MSDSETKTKISLLPDIPDSIDNAVKNMTGLPSQGVGKTLSDVWFLVFGSLSQKADLRRMKYAADIGICSLTTLGKNFTEVCI